MKWRESQPPLWDELAAANASIQVHLLMFCEQSLFSVHFFHFANQNVLCDCNSMSQEDWQRHVALWKHVRSPAVSHRPYLILKAQYVGIYVIIAAGACCLIFRR
jgi:hypothetical protein